MQEVGTRAYEPKLLEDALQGDGRGAELERALVVRVDGHLVVDPLVVLDGVAFERADRRAYRDRALPGRGGALGPAKFASVQEDVEAAGRVDDEEEEAVEEALDAHELHHPVPVDAAPV